MFESNQKSNYKELVLMISIFSMIYASSSYNVAIMSGTLTLLICGLSSVLVIMVSKKGGISTRLFFSVILLCIPVLITTLFTDDTFKDSVIMLLSIFISMVFVLEVDFKKYCEIYSKTILIIAVYSLVAYFLSIVAPSIIRIFPPAYFRPSFEVYNLGFSFVHLNYNGLPRNMGIFWEPGAYQTYLVFAIIIELLIFPRIRKINLVIFGLTLLTTWSTTGIINGLILLLIYILLINKYSRIKFVKSAVTICLMGIIIFSIYWLLPNNIQYASIGKILTYLQSDNQSNITSASVRFSATFEPLKAYLESPIYGVGYSGLGESVLSAGHTMITNTVVNWFAAYGTCFGLLCLYGVYNFSKKLNNNISPLVLVLIIVTILLSITTEQYLRNVSIIIFLLYGLSETKIRYK